MRNVILAGICCFCFLLILCASSVIAEEGLDLPTCDPDNIEAPCICGDDVKTVIINKRLYPKMEFCWFFGQTSPQTVEMFKCHPDILEFTIRDGIYIIRICKEDYYAIKWKCYKIILGKAYPSPESSDPTEEDDPLPGEVNIPTCVAGNIQAPCTCGDDIKPVMINKNYYVKEQVFWYYKSYFPIVIQMFKCHPDILDNVLHNGQYIVKICKDYYYAVEWKGSLLLLGPSFPTSGKKFPTVGKTNLPVLSDPPLQPAVNNLPVLSKLLGFPACQKGNTKTPCCCHAGIPIKKVDKTILAKPILDKVRVRNKMKIKHPVINKCLDLGLVYIIACHGDFYIGIRIINTWLAISPLKF